jgi:hypothetical protein
MKVLRQEMLGDWELTVFAVPHPLVSQPPAITYQLRLRTLRGRFTRPLTDNSQGFSDEDAAWAAAIAHIKRLSQ